jgi:hypothetical protein
MDYSKKGKSGTVNRQFNPAKTAALMTGIGQSQCAMEQNGQYRAKRVAAPARPGQGMYPLNPAYEVDPRGVTPAEDTQENEAAEK